MLWAALMLLVSGSSYEGLAARARTVPNFGRMLEAFVGQCDRGDVEAGFDKKRCQQDVEQTRRSMSGRLMRVVIDDPGPNMALAGFDSRKGAFRVDIVPFFQARGMGLSVGRPQRLNDQGLPVMRHLPVWVKLPEDTPTFIFRRNLERGMVRLELVIVPKAAYRIRRQGREVVRGLEVDLKALRVVGARNGEVLAEHIYQE